METETVAASGSNTLTQAELSALLKAAIAAKREQAEGIMAPAAPEPVRFAHWGNTDYGRILGTGAFVLCMCVGLALLCGGVALILAALRGG